MQSVGSPNVNELGSVQNAVDNSGTQGAASNGGAGSSLFGTTQSGLATAGSLFNISNGLRSGTPTGQAQAALGAAGLANKAGAFGSASSSVGAGLGAAGGALGVVNGIRQGGVQGYGQAAVSGLRAGSAVASLAGNSGLASGLGAAAGYAAVPLSVFNAVKNYQSGDTSGDAIRGAEAGAAIGSVVPIVGTAVGALVGGAVGAISSAFGSGKVDPENANFNGFSQAYNAAKTPQEKAQVAASTQDPYLPLAGLFDLRSNQIKGNIPIVAQYGRKGEQQFATDMFTQMNKAVNDGTIDKNASTTDIMAKVVQPWISSFGKGQMKDSNADAINAMIGGLVDDYRTGQTGNLKAVGGDQAFKNLPPFGSSGSAVNNLVQTAQKRVGAGK